MTKERRAKIDETLVFLQNERWPEQQHTDYIGVLAGIVAELLDEIVRLQKAGKRA